MNTLYQSAPVPHWRLLAGGLSLWALGACSALGPATTPPAAFYALNATPAAAPKAAPDTAPTLMVNPPQASAGFDSARIIFVREPHKLEYFSHSEWVDPPARMLGALLVNALAHSGAFRAVVLAPGAGAGDLRLDTEIIRLQHEFQTRPSRVRFTLRAYLVDDKTRRVLAWREFDGYAAAVSEDPHGGVVAANRAVQTVLDELSQFLTERQK